MVQVEECECSRQELRPDLGQDFVKEKDFVKCSQPTQATREIKVGGSVTGEREREKAGVEGGGHRSPQREKLHSTPEQHPGLTCWQCLEAETLRNQRLQHLGWAVAPKPAASAGCFYSSRCESGGVRVRLGNQWATCVTPLLPEPEAPYRVAPLVFALRSLMEEAAVGEMGTK